MNAYFDELYDMYDGSDDVQLVGFSVDPAVDSVPRLLEYAESFGVDDNRWMFLRGPMDTIVHICEDYFMLPAEDLPGSHTTKFALVDQNNVIRGYYSGTDPSSFNVLKTHIRELLGQME
jgi:protein SCO1/2